MTDATAAPAPSPWLDIVKAAMPYLGQIMVLLVTFGTGMYAQHVLQKPFTLQAADGPKPTPMVSAGDVDHIVQQHCADIRGLLLERLPAPKGAPKR